MAYFIKGAPFRYNGAINVEDCITSLEVMQKAHLDWTVEKCEVFAKMKRAEDSIVINGFNDRDNTYRAVPNAYATYIKETNMPLGIVKERYTPVQNVEAFKFFDGAIGKNKAIWQTAGYFGNGERVFVSAKLPNYITVKGDLVENYLVFTTSHDGSTGVKILFTPIRVVCQNTLNAAIQSSTNYVSFRHTNSVHDNLNIANEILGICDKRADIVSEKFNYMRSIKFTDSMAMNLFANVLLTETEKENIITTGHNIKEIITRDWNAISDSEISMKKVNALSAMTNYYFNGIGQKEILGTAWGAYNAVTGYYSNIDNAIGIKRMDSLLYGDKSRKIELAGNLIYNAA